MSDVKNMLDWFSRRKSDTVQTGSRSHGLAVVDVVIEVDRAINAMTVGDTQAALKCVDRMILSEKEADRIEIRLCTEITDGLLSMQERENLLQFVKKLDLIADWANEAGAYIQLIIDTKIPVPQYMWEATKQMSNELILSVKMLIRAIENISDNLPEARRCVESIKDQERIIDQLNYTLFRKILVSEMDYKGVMLTRGMIEALEQSSDACESCGDTIMILMLSRRV